MKLSDAEKLTVSILCEIHTALKLNQDGMDSKFISKAIDTGNEWAISYRYGDFLGFKDTTLPSEVSYVYNILDMWGFIEEAAEELTQDEKKELEQKAAPFGKSLKFPGFDGNNESRYHSIAHFIANETDGFGGRFAKRDLNSHTRRVDVYQRMYEHFQPWRDNYPERPLNVDELVMLLNARNHQ